MKAMKKYFKVVLAFIAFALCSFMLVFSPTLTAHAAFNYSADNLTNTYNLAFNAIKMPTSVDVGIDESSQKQKEEFLIPVPKFSSEYSDVTVRVYDPSGSVAHDYIIKEAGEDINAPASGEADFFATTLKKENGEDALSSDTNKFIKVASLNNGTYKVVYILKDSNSNTVYSNTYSVKVVNAMTYKLNMEMDLTSDKYVKLVPSASKTNEELVIPYAYVTDAEGNKVEQSGSAIKIKPTIMVDGVKIDDADKDDYYSLVEDNGVLKFTPKKDAPDGLLYTLVYEYKYGTNYPSVKYDIEVSNNFVAPAESSLQQYSVPTLPKFELGDKGISLDNSKLTIGYSATDIVDYNTTSIEIRKVSNKNIKITLPANTYTFDMTLEAFNIEGLTYADLIGDYQIVYTLEDAYGNEFTNASTPIVVENVNITSKPNAYFAYEYATTVEGLANANTNGLELIKKEYGYNQVILPALYAEDKLTENEDYDDIQLVRYLKRKIDDKYFYIDNKVWNGETVKTLTAEDAETAQYKEGYNYSPSANNGANTITEFWFKEGGNDSSVANDYILEYLVISHKGGKIRVQTIKSSTITITESGSISKSDAPTVTVTNDENRVRTSKGFEITFNTKETTDDNLTKVAFYYKGSKTNTELKTALKNALTELEGKIKAENSDSVAWRLTDNMLEISTEASESLQTLMRSATYGFEEFTIVPLKDGIYAIEDSIKGNYTVGAIALNDYNNLDADSMVVTFVNTEDDYTAPTYEFVANKYGSLHNGSVFTFEKSFKQGEVITLPTLQFKDDTANTLWTASVRYYVGSPIVKDKDENEIGTQYLRPDNYGITPTGEIYGGTITAGKIGTYTVVYSAMDEAGNVTIVYFTFKVESKANPVISYKVSGTSVTNSGNSYEVEAGQQLRIKTNMTDVSTDEDVTKLTDQTKLNLEITRRSGDASYDIVDGAYVFSGSGTFEVVLSGSYKEKASDADNDAIKAISQSFTIKVVNKTTLKWADESAFNAIPTYEKADQDIYLPYINTNMEDARVTVKVTRDDNQPVTCTETSNTSDGSAQAQYWMFHTDSEKTKAVYKVTYTATAGTQTIEKVVSITVGDNVPPTISISNSGELTKDVVFDGTNAIDFMFNVSVDGRTFKVKLNGQTYNLTMVISDRDDQLVSSPMTKWTKLTYKLIKDGETKLETNNSVYSIKEAGTYTIEITAEDGNLNVSKPYSISFKVVLSSDIKETKDTVVGVVLIILSLVVLAGVIVFFFVTGKKGGSKKSKKSKKSTKKVENQVKDEVVETKDETVAEVKETTDAEEVKAEEVKSDDEAKTGEVE